MQFLCYDYSTQDIIRSQRLNISETCNGWTVKNAGTSVVEVKGDPLQPGESKSVGGNYGEIFVGRVDLLFTGAGTNLAIYTEKFYVAGKNFDPPIIESR
jgi:hypothetical protein